MLQTSTLDFLKNVKKNNNREWFEKNRAKYEAARQDFAEFISKLITEIAKHDATVKGVQAKDCIFRIYRDVRFSKNKDPYKTNFGAVVGAGGRKSDKAIFYMQVEPGNSFVAGGKWMPPAPQLKDIRQEIFYNVNDFKKILNEKSFKKNFKELSDIKLKTAPKGFDKEFPDIELLKYTSYIAETKVDDKILLSKNVYKHCAALHKAMMPFQKFLNDAAG